MLFRESFLSTFLTNQVQTLTLIRLCGFVVGADKLPNVPDPSLLGQGNTGTCSWPHLKQQGRLSWPSLALLMRTGYKLSVTSCQNSPEQDFAEAGNAEEFHTLI